MGVRVRERDGAWWVFINHQGKRKAKRIGVGEPGKKAAKAVAEKVQAKLALGDFGILKDAPKSVTFAEYAEKWLKVYAHVHCKPSTVEEYEKRVRLHLNPTFGAVVLHEISREKIKTFLVERMGAGNTRRKGGSLGAGSVRNILLVLRAILFHAMDDGLLASNPAARLGKFAKRKDETADDRPDVFTREELAHLLAVADRDMPETYPPILTMAKTGIRESELFGLQPADLDFTRKILWVRRGIVRGRISTPKNGKVRRVDMPAQLCRVLQDYLTRRDAEAVLAGREPSPWLFPMPNGEPMALNYFLRVVWNPLLDRAGLPRRGPHQARHSYVALLIDQGAHPKYLQEQLGHSSIQITMDIYGHLFEGSHRRYVDALDTVLEATSCNARATESAPPATPALISAS